MNDEQKTEVQEPAIRPSALLPGVVTSPLGDLIVPVEHFGKCPFDTLKREEFGRNQWSLSRGGSPVPDRVWTIDIFQTDADGEVEPGLHYERWVMPEIFTMLFDNFEGIGRDGQLRKIKDALGLSR